MLVLCDKILSIFRKTRGPLAHAAVLFFLRDNGLLILLFTNIIKNGLFCREELVSNRILIN